jgi:hypothetical protein
MSTRGFVGVMVGNVCRAVYVHHDCYLSGVGATLQSYATQDEVESLISGGDMSSMGDYYKDRGETDVDARDYNDFDEFLNSARDAGVQYYYIFRDGVWYCGDTHGSFVCSTSITGKLVPYSQAVQLMGEHA